MEEEYLQTGGGRLGSGIGKKEGLGSGASVLMEGGMRQEKRRGVAYLSILGLGCKSGMQKRLMPATLRLEEEFRLKYSQSIQLVLHCSLQLDIS